MADPYATHLPVLEGLKPKPKKVLEFGGGLYSTKAFLDMDSVRKLVTVETDPGWHAKLQKKFDDKRWTLSDGTDVPPLEDFDLVFVDDGMVAQERIATIVRVLGQQHPRVVIHDAEYPPYRETIHGFTTDYELHQDATPHTAVIPASEEAT